MGNSGGMDSSDDDTYSDAEEEVSLSAAKLYKTDSVLRLSTYYQQSQGAELSASAYTLQLLHIINK